MNTDKIIIEVRENQEKLTACKRHDFARKGNSGRELFRFVCKACGGEVDVVAARFYEKGLEHGAQK